jgi:hypothetical protein
MQNIPRVENSDTGDVLSIEKYRAQAYAEAVKRNAPRTARK